ncbi:MAG: polymerase alpha subunit, partial [Bacillota bacterium]|nr:polymerase alpha subunit [Bacillota bacterium]
MKRIKDVFSDFKLGDNISIAIVDDVVLSKNTKTIEMKISSDKYIELRELDNLNDFIKKRFGLNECKIVVNYAHGTYKKPIEEELKNIVFHLANNYPALK